MWLYVSEHAACLLRLNKLGPDSKGSDWEPQMSIYSHARRLQGFWFIRIMKTEDVNKHPQQCNNSKGRYFRKTRCKGLKLSCLMSPTGSANVHNCPLRICLLQVLLRPSPSSKSAEDLAGNINPVYPI